MLPARVAALAFSGFAALPLLPLPPAEPAATELWIAVAPIRTEDDLQRLARLADTRGWYQELALALGSAADATRLQRTWPSTRPLAAFDPAERLYAVTLLPGEEILDRPGMRVLFESPTLAIVGLPADVPLDLHELLPLREFEPFHDGVSVVPARRMSPARGSRHRPPRGAAPPVADPRVSAIVAAVTEANLDADVDHYSNDFHTRRSDQADGVNAQNDLLARFQALGITAFLHDFDANADNVIAEIPGLLEPDKVVIVGAHYDSINYAGPSTRAPGADDNASGTAAVLELARVFAQSGQAFRYTVRFCCFASEEFGLYGSDAYSGDLVADGVEVVAMLNTDMNSYKASGDARDLDFVTNDTTGWLTDDLEALSLLYVPALPVVKGSLSGGTSDHRSFYYDGYPAAFYFEDIGSYSPYIHGSGDTYGTSANDFTLAVQIVQSVAAGLATYAEPVDLAIDHAALADTEDSWNPSLVRASVISHVGTTPIACELHWDAGASANVAVMTGSGAPDEWIGEIPGQPSGTTVSYHLFATDSAGYTERFPAAGELEYLTGVRDTFFFDGFESGIGGWSTGGTEDDWMLGTPQGKSTDPASAYSGSSCFANDLGNTGYNGEYRANANCWLYSPTIDASGKTNVHLRYARWLGVEDGVYDQAEVRVFSNLHWTNPVGSGSDHWIDTQWQIHDLDVSSSADNNPGFHLRFKIISDGGLEFGGWNVDDVEMYSLVAGTEPELWRDVAVISLAAGGTTHLQVNLGAAQANRPYVLLAGISGTDPGFDWGQTHVDLNYDLVTSLFLKLLPALPGFLGTTDAAGRATATLDLPPGLDPGASGTTLHLVAVTLAPTDRSTPPVAIHLAD